MASGRKHDNNKSQKRSKPDPVNSFGSEDNNNNNQMMKISLTSISKLEVKSLKQKLQTELDEVRNLLKRFETRDGFGNKKVKTIPSGKKTELDKGKVQILKNCGNLLTKLMKHKHGWIFNVPVDATGLGLHDYHTIVTKPMDLGTVKSKLSKGCYKSSPLDFAEDVRLVFGNALLYNPKGHDVYVCAEMLLSMFEEKWVSIEKQYETLNRKQGQQTRDVGFYAPVPYVAPVPLRAPSPSPPPVVVDDRGLERAESMTNVVEAEEEVVAVVPEKVEEEEEVRENKVLTFDEKRTLSEDLQELPFDKLEAVVQIIKKRNPELAQEDDEIELDIESLDLETLWELYRYVTEYKESSSKQKEGHGLESERYAESVHDSVQEPVRNTLVSGHESSKVAELGHVASPVRQKVNAGGSSSSNSSSSGSGSCSSDSDSGSSGHGSGN